MSTLKVEPLDVRSQVSEKLYARFSDRIPNIFTDTPVQGLVKPCFFIHSLETNQNREMRNRARRSYFLDIRAHPPDDIENKKSWCAMIGDELFEILDEIKIAGMAVKTQEMRFEVVEDVLHFFVTYSFRVIKMVDPETKMEDLDIHGSTYGKE